MGDQEWICLSGRTHFFQFFQESSKWPDFCSGPDHFLKKVKIRKIAVRANGPENGVKNFHFFAPKIEKWPPDDFSGPGPEVKIRENGQKSRKFVVFRPIHGPEDEFFRENRYIGFTGTWILRQNVDRGIPPVYILAQDPSWTSIHVKTATVGGPCPHPENPTHGVRPRNFPTGVHLGKNALRRKLEWEIG